MTVEVLKNNKDIKFKGLKVNSTSSGNLTYIYINLGKNSTIKVGDKILIYEEGEVI